jgi:hypothetical protein
MAKTTYASLKLKVNTQPKKITFQDHEIEVLQYLPIEDKYDLVMITLQNCYEEGIYNPIKRDMYFHLYLVYMYSDINFTDKQKEDVSKLYDTLESNGLLDAVIAEIPESEYNLLFSYLQEMIDEKSYYNTSASALVKSFITDLPRKAQEAVEALNQFDPSKFQAVQEFAKAANGNREIQ